MARKRKQNVPAHRFIRVDLKHTGSGEDFHYIDLARELSAINNRLYRQGMTYHVANISVHDSQSSYTKFCTLPNTWAMRNAWKRAFQMWLNMNDQLAEPALRNAAKASKYTDFKVYFNADHIDDTDKPKFTDVEGNLRTDGEWEHTRFFSTDGGTVDGFTVHMMGNHVGSAGSYSSVSAIKAYNETLTYPENESEQSTFDTGVWNNLIESSGVNDDISNALSDDNDEPPYDEFVFPGMKPSDVADGNCPQPWSVREVHLQGTYQNSAMVGGFEVPCGLMCIETSGTADNTIGLIIELAPGSYKGVSAESMGTPKKTNDKIWKVS